MENLSVLDLSDEAFEAVVEFVRHAREVAWNDGLREGEARERAYAMDVDRKPTTNPYRKEKN